MIAKNSSSCKDTNKCHAQKSSSWSWKDKLKLSRRVWSASNLESFIDISSSCQTQVSLRYVYPNQIRYCHDKFNWSYINKNILFSATWLKRDPSSLKVSSNVIVGEDDDSCDNKTKDSVTDENGISVPSISVRSQGTTGSLCYVCILVIPIAITVASLLLYNYTSIMRR